MKQKTMESMMQPFLSAASRSVRRASTVAPDVYIVYQLSPLHFTSGSPDLSAVGHGARSSF